MIDRHSLYSLNIHLWQIVFIFSRQYLWLTDMIYWKIEKENAEINYLYKILKSIKKNIFNNYFFSLNTFNSYSSAAMPKIYIIKVFFTAESALFSLL